MVYIFVSKLNKYIGLTNFSPDTLQDQAKIIRCKLIRVSVKYINLAFIAFVTTIVSLIIHVLSGFYKDVHVHAFDTAMILGMSPIYLYICLKSTHIYLYIIPQKHVDTIANMFCLYLQINFYGSKSKKKADYYIVCHYCDRCCFRLFSRLTLTDVLINLADHSYGTHSRNASKTLSTTKQADPVSKTISITIPVSKDGSSMKDGSSNDHTSSK